MQEAEVVSACLAKAGFEDCMTDLLHGLDFTDTFRG